MPTFRYITRDAGGTPQAGTLTAGSVELLTAELRGRGLLVLEVEPVDAETGTKQGFSLFGWLPATSFDVEMGLQQLAAMLTSGLSLLSSLKTVAEQARRPKATRVWLGVSERIEQGGTFSSALAAYPKVFSDHVVQLVKVGEASGNLDVALRSSAEHLERSRNLRLTVVNALAYPAIVILLAVGVTAFLMIGVIPKIQKFLSGAGRKLPGLTQALVDVSSWVQTYLPYIAVIFLAMVIGFIFTYFWPPGRLVIDRIFLRLPIFGGILRLSGTATFSRGLGILLESGVTLLDGLKTVERLLKNKVLADHVASARLSVLRGGTLAASLSDRRAFMPMLGRMVAVGESAGTLAPVLGEVAKFHENQLVASIRRMSVLIEPVVIIVVGAIVGFVYIAFFVALFSITGGIR